MTQSIIIQVGQCGNQIGCRFWDLALKEHGFANKAGLYDESVASFFRNVDPRKGADNMISAGDRNAKIKALKARVRNAQSHQHCARTWMQIVKKTMLIARSDAQEEENCVMPACGMEAIYVFMAVLIDMEEGVVNEILKGPLASIFENQQLVTDVSGSGNNWATGHLEYGMRYKDQISNAIRRAAEKCDCLQCFLTIHSMGGGTGSGLGTFVLGLIEDEYPEVYRFTTAVYPSEDDDVITSPYNTLLAMHQLTRSADCVLPVENQALMDIVKKVQSSLPPSRPGKRQAASVAQVSGTTSKKGASQGPERPFDTMNNIVANLILNLTSSSRFEGSLNVDLNEITTNLVPYPKLHYLVSSMAPLYTVTDMQLPGRRLNQMFTDAFCKDNQLLKVDPRHNLYLACALMVRGKVEMSDLRTNIDRLKTNLDFIYWNQEGWKTGLCSVPPGGYPYSLLVLANNTCIRSRFEDVKERFLKLYKRKAHLHHYTRVDGFDQDLFQEGIDSLEVLCQEYKDLDRYKGKKVEDAERLRIV